MSLRDRIFRDKEQNTIVFTCPNCNKQYTPVLKRKHPNIPIQMEFRDSPAWQREQHISGLCSDECWNEFIGGKQ